MHFNKYNKNTIFFNKIKKYNFFLNKIKKDVIFHQKDYKNIKLKNIENEIKQYNVNIILKIKIN